MRALLQRVSRASVKVDDEVVGTIDTGLLVLVGFGRSDAGRDPRPMADRILNLRVFPDQRGRFDRSLIDVGGGVLLVPQFTLYAQTRKGRRPDFSEVMGPGDAAVMFDRFVHAVAEAGAARVETGRFGADMQIELVNDGPVTLMLDED